jgi:exonuclease I
MVSIFKYPVVVILILLVSQNAFAILTHQKYVDHSIEFTKDASELIDLLENKKKNELLPKLDAWHQKISGFIKDAHAIKNLEEIEELSDEHKAKKDLPLEDKYAVTTNFKYRILGILAEELKMISYIGRTMTDRFQVKEVIKHELLALKSSLKAMESGLESLTALAEADDIRIEIERLQKKSD